MDIKAPKSEPTKSIEKPNIEKAEKTEIASKPNIKPDTKPKNKIEPRKIDPKKEPKHNLQPRKIDPKIPPKHKIEPRKINPSKEPNHKLQPRKIDPKAPSRHKIEPRKIDHMKEPILKIQPQRSTPEISEKKITLTPTSEPMSTAKLEVNQLSLEQIKQEIKKINWKNISENWNISNNPKRYVKHGIITLDPTNDPSRENPLYRHKQWLQTVYNNSTWNLNGTNLGKICGVDQRTISRWQLKHNIMTKLNLAQQKLFFDNKSKECGHCHEIKPHASFTFRRKNEILYPKSTCKKCDGEKKQIFALKNKIKVIENLYKGKLGTKCPECNTGPEKLPALEFHHTIPSIKKTSWHPRMYKNWEGTKEILEREKVKILCRNCHTKQRAKTYKNYENIIKRANFNLNSSTEKIKKYIKKNSSKPINSNNLRNVSTQIKKITIINKLYGGKCIGCEQINTKNNLPSLNFHHRDINQDEGKLWSKINNFELKQIKNEFIKKNCISLCGNCHQMIHSTNFKTQHEEIIGSEHWGQVKTYYNVLEKKVKNFKFKKDNTRAPMIKTIKNVKKIEGIKTQKKPSNQMKLSSPNLHLTEKMENPARIKTSEKRMISNLNYQYGYGEAWKKYLTHITNLSKEGKKVKTLTLAESVGVNTRNTRKNIQKLITKGMISINGEHNNRTIILTEKGKKESERIKKE